MKFNDGTPLNVASIVAILPDALRAFMGPVFADVDNIKASDDTTVEIRFRKPSPFLVEALEAPIRKPGPTIIGTGPYVTAEDSATALRSNGDYYLGRPVIDRIVLSNYPSVRSAWAEMLRNRLDMLHDLGPEALGSMEASTTISTFTYTRHYQYVVALNTKSLALRSRDVRRALNWAIDRSGIVKDALNGHGVASSQPLSSRYWAIEPNTPQFGYDPDRAIRAFGKPLHFTCLVPPDAVSERIALQLKRQLQSVGVDMALEDASQDRIVRLTTERRYEAALVEFISGPTLFRPYLVWHSGTPLNSGVGNESMDAALDRVRQAPSEREYRVAVTGLLQAFMDDPPAIFLAWSVRARAISKRFAVEAEEGRDVMSTLRLWKPTAGQQQASRN